MRQQFNPAPEKCISDQCLCLLHGGVIDAGSEMLQQFEPWYIGMAFPWTLPVAVGGFDLENDVAWRRTWS